MRVEVASHAPHGAKYGPTFAERWTLTDGTTVAAVGAVIGGEDRVAVADLLRAGVRAVVTSRRGLPGAVEALDRIVRSHARERRDDLLAAAITLLAVPADGVDVDAVGAGPLPTAIVDGNGVAHAVRAHAAALGAGSQLANATTVRVHRDDVLVATTASIPAAWFAAPDRSANALLRLAREANAAAAVVRP